MYTLVFTAPSAFTAKFQVTKHRAEAPSPRNSRFPRFTGAVSRVSSSRTPETISAGSMNASP